MMEPKRIGLSCVMLLLVAMLVNAQQVGETKMNGLYGIEVETITGDVVSLGAYKGKALLIVNTASKCGFTGQYEGLQKLYETYKEKGLIVLGFPSNDFLRQEPGDNAEIQTFCSLNYGVTFPMFSKLRVKGKEQHPLYRFLTSKQSNPGFSGKISWNFNKFLIDRKGVIVARFGSRTTPDDAKLIAAVKAALKAE